MLSKFVFYGLEMYMLRQYGIVWTVITVLLIAVPLFSATWGTVAGRVTDAVSSEPLTGVNVIIEGTDLGAATDNDGRFLIIRTAPGKYRVMASMMGYKRQVQENVVVHADLRATVDFQLEQGAVEGEPVVVEGKRGLQKDITATTRFVDAEKMEVLPIQSFLDAVELQPGIHEGHVRGGRKSELLYLVDGMPLQDAIQGEVSAQLPNQVIADISVQTGGFAAEYGNAMSGVVNVLTREGRDVFSAGVKLQNESLLNNLTPFAGQPPYNQRVEAKLEGRLFSTGAFVFGSANLNTPLSPWKHEEFGERRSVFPDGESWELNSVVKLHNRVDSPFRIVLTELVSLREWTEYEHRWKLNTIGLPPRRRQSYRTTLSITHTLSPDVFYHLNLGHYFVLKSVLGQATDLLEFYRIDEDQGDYVISGDYPWWMDHEETQQIVKFGYVNQINHYHQLKSGLEFTQYDLYKKNLLIRELPAIDPDFRRYVTYNSEYEYDPWMGALYLQDKMDYDQLVVNVGLRYDYFEPKASRPAVEQQISEDMTEWVIDHDSTVAATPKSQFSPRIGVAFLIGPDSEMRVNYGHFFQMPAFEYLYTNSNLNTAAGFSPVSLGNPDLSPSRTVAYEWGVRAHVGEYTMIDATLFNKDVANLIDVGTYLDPGAASGDIPVTGFVEYRNLAYANIKGAEFVFSRELVNGIGGEVSYTYMSAVGTGSSELTSLLQLSEEYQTSNSAFPLSWDQRHGVVAILELERKWLGHLTFLWQWNSGFPYTKYVGYGTHPNNFSLNSTSSLDIRFNRKFTFWNSTLNLFAEVINAFDSDNNLWADYDGSVGGRLHDPTAWDLGRVVRLGFSWEN